MEIKVLKAKHGDCILLKWYSLNSNAHYILIDSGVYGTYRLIKKELESVTNLDAFVLTHIDDDHIGGFIKFAERNKLNDINVVNYFINTPQLIEIDENNSKKNIPQANNLMALLKQYNQFHKCSSLSYENSSPIKTLFDGSLEIEVISPNDSHLIRLVNEFNKYAKKPPKKFKKSNEFDLKHFALSDLATNNDTINSNIFNDSSIVLFVKDIKNSILLLADSNPKIVERNLRALGYSKTNKLVTDYVKLSHHGSKYNISKSLLSLIKSNNYIISTNGGMGNTKHPDRETIAKIVCSLGRDKNEKIVFWFNYPKGTIERRNGLIITEDEELTYNFECRYINEEILQ